MIRDRYGMTCWHWLAVAVSTGQGEAPNDWSCSFACTMTAHWVWSADAYLRNNLQHEYYMLPGSDAWGNCIVKTIIKGLRNGGQN